MMIESKIIKLLQKRALEIINDNKFVKCINMNFNPPADKKWWEILYIPNNYTNEFWDEGKTYRGILRLILHWPQKSQGIYKPLEEAERVAEGFKKGLELYDEDGKIKVVIIDEPDLTNVLEEQTQLLIGLTIRYSCFTL